MTEHIYPQTLTEYLKEAGEIAASNAIASMLECDNEHLTDCYLPNMSNDDEKADFYDFVRTHGFYLEATKQSIESETERIGALLVAEYELEPARFTHDRLEYSLGHEAWAMEKDLDFGWRSDSLPGQLLSDEQLVACFRAGGSKSIVEPSM